MSAWLLTAARLGSPASKVIDQGLGPCPASRQTVSSHFKSHRRVQPRPWAVSCKPCQPRPWAVSYARGCCHAGTDSGDISAHLVQIRIRDARPLRQIAGHLMQPATTCFLHMVGPLQCHWPSALVCGLATGDVPSFETADDLVMGESCGRNRAEGAVLDARCTFLAFILVASAGYVVANVAAVFPCLGDVGETQTALDV